MANGKTAFSIGPDFFEFYNGVDRLVRCNGREANADQKQAAALHLRGLLAKEFRLLKEEGRTPADLGSFGKGIVIDIMQSLVTTIGYADARCTPEWDIFADHVV